MNVLIVESPSKAKSINKYLGSNFKVLASVGHVRDLSAKNDAIDTENDFKMKWETQVKGINMLRAKNKMREKIKNADKNSALGILRDAKIKQQLNKEYEARKKELNKLKKK